VTPAELEPGYEQVFSVTDYYDGPLQRVADFQGEPHFYDRVFAVERDEYSDLFHLTPISHQTLELAIEDWAIFRRFELAFHTGKATIETHPALPQDRARHEELKVVLDAALRTDFDKCVTRIGIFETLGSQPLPRGVLRDLQVKWTMPDEE